MRSLRFNLLTLLAGFSLPLAAQTLFVPGGSVGNISGSNVGIGTSTPSNTPNAIGISAGLYAGTYSYLELATASEGGGWIDFSKADGSDYAGRIRYDTANDRFHFFTAGSGNPSLVISSSGNVGIGTVSPSARLAVNGALSLDPMATNSAGYWAIRHGAIDVLTVYTDNVLSIDNPVGGGGVGKDIRFRTDSGSERMRIRSSTGNVGIGAAAPQEKLEVAGNILLNPADKYLKIFANTEGVDSIVFARSDNSQQSSIATTAFGKSILFKVGGSEIVRFRNDGNVGIGTTNPTHKLAVNGTIRAKEVIVDTGWADYVFADDYRLAPLSEVEAHIRTRGHLPDIPSAAEVAEHGVSMGDMQAKLLAKIEELTLHQIAQEKRLNAQAARLAQLEQENAALRQP